MTPSKEMQTNVCVLGDSWGWLSFGWLRVTSVVQLLQIPGAAATAEPLQWAQTKIRALLSCSSSKSLPLIALP